MTREREREFVQRAITYVIMIGGSRRAECASLYMIVTVASFVKLKTGCIFAKLSSDRIARMHTLINVQTRDPNARILLHYGLVTR